MQETILFSQYLMSHWTIRSKLNSCLY